MSEVVQTACQESKAAPGLKDPECTECIKRPHNHSNSGAFKRHQFHVPNLSYKAFGKLGRCILSWGTLCLIQYTKMLKDTFFTKYNFVQICFRFIYFIRGGVVPSCMCTVCFPGAWGGQKSVCPLILGYRLLSSSVDDETQTWPSARTTDAPNPWTIPGPTASSGFVFEISQQLLLMPEHSYKMRKLFSNVWRYNINTTLKYLFSMFFPYIRANIFLKLEILIHAW